MKTIYSCVCDVPAKYRSQTLVWVRTLLELAGRSPEELVVHMIGTDRDFERALEEYEVTVVHVPAFDTRRPYSNKLVQLTSEALRECDFAVLCDCDLAFCDDISAWVTGDAVRAKLVDLANPPLEYWRRLFREAGFAHAPAGVHPTHEGIATYANNLNGGLYILPAQAFEELARAWPRWRAWTVKRETLLGPYAVHVF